MIRVTSIKRCKVSEYDRIYLIVRSIASLERNKSAILQYAIHLPDLSPSKKLFYGYLDWQKSGKLTQEVINAVYKPKFLKELTSNQNAQILLDKIKAEDVQGLKIALITFASNENLDHRSIIGELLRQKGCTIVFDRDTRRGID